jgi:all-trans-retinol 13,14-reductase
METLTSYVLNNPTALIFVVPIVLLATLVIYILTFPPTRPVQSRRADKFHPSKVPSNLDTIVIGSGSGGSTVANLLAQSGQRVLVLEQHSVTGGCTHSFREEGCEWDTGLVSILY